MKQFTVSVLTTTGRIEIRTTAEDKIQAIEKIEKKVAQHTDWIEVIGVR